MILFEQYSAMAQRPNRLKSCCGGDIDSSFALGTFGPVTRKQQGFRG